MRNGLVTLPRLLQLERANQALPKMQFSNVVNKAT